jgi:hypothetical protein
MPSVGEGFEGGEGCLRDLDVLFHSAAGDA